MRSVLLPYGISCKSSRVCGDRCVWLEDHRGFGLAWMLQMVYLLVGGLRNDDPKLKMVREKSKKLRKVNIWSIFIFLGVPLVGFILIDRAMLSPILAIDSLAIEILATRMTFVRRNCKYKSEVGCTATVKLLYICFVQRSAIWFSKFTITNRG